TRTSRARRAREVAEAVEGTRIRRLDQLHIDAAIVLTDLEAWGYTREDFRRLLALAPDACFVAELDGRVVGVLTTTTYDGLAFLGDRKSTRLNSSHEWISYAVFCLKKKKATS